jgi:hypothetical protein
MRRLLKRHQDIRVIQNSPFITFLLSSDFERPRLAGGGYRSNHDYWDNNSDKLNGNLAYG